ncbi:MAG: hypothetical protein COT92_00230 [Candidatus Doudnabacteria bacterium CG10_big_fil_rev_8_21_14_0_10_42_18]|uniref:YbaK/aminoacyl-tRNA synthetase-associated domain-containing protein n=1 Tax=Candidatus Doudnabacteria bacterium CG10_big_fil_rev_8_21_14_0_10_42_18 TaxID=1974552 RepID=A0A2H0VBZ5_9BACT|nr:MAG: hypothetical protein COT92_00230 [Candidatus Doudnabacteria bacterium CG10_big_fil_rev_8_21_14_0_10_42_18]
MPKKKISKSKKKKVQKPFKRLKNQVTKLLDEAKVKYSVIEHKLIYTAHDAAKTTKKKLGEIAKVVLVKVEGPSPVIAKERERLKQSSKRLPRSLKGSLAMTKYFTLTVLPAGKYVDLKGIKKALKAKKVSLAKEKDIAKYLKTKVGLLHPFGQLFKIPTLLDKGFSKSKKMIASAGSFTHSAELAMKDFERLAQPTKGVFSRNKK